MIGGASGSGLVVAASIGVVEALKDQLGVCRWNYALRSMQKRARSGVRSYYQTHILRPPPPPPYSSEKMVLMMREKIGRREMGFRRVRELSCWGPPTVRF